VKNRYVSIDGAKRLYGVVVKEDYSVDARATRELRDRLRNGDVPFDISDLYARSNTLAWLLTRSEESLGRLDSAAQRFSGVIRLATERGDRFHYAKILASDPYVIRKLVSSLKDSSISIHTIQYFSKESRIWELL
jgi:hypothetical protein